MQKILKKKLKNVALVLSGMIFGTNFAYLTALAERNLKSIASTMNSTNVLLLVFALAIGVTRLIIWANENSQSSGSGNQPSKPSDSQNSSPGSNS